MEQNDTAITAKLRKWLLLACPKAHNPRMNRIQFELELAVEELSNVPITEEHQCYLNIGVSNHKKGAPKHHRATTETAPIKNHKVLFGAKGRFKTIFKVNTDPRTQLLSNKYLTIEFFVSNLESSFSNSKQHKDIRIGIMKINLTEHINESKPQKIQYLLENCKVNAIAKVNLFLRHLDNDQQTLYNIPEQSNNHIYRGLTETFEDSTSLSFSSPHNSTGTATSTTHLSNRKSQSPVASPTVASSSITRDSSINYGANSKLTHRKSTLAKAEAPYVPPHLLSRSMKKCRSSTQSKSQNSLTSDDSATPRLNRMVGESIRFSCDIAALRYDEFTAEECIEDIIYSNGNGWRRNNQGLNMVDVLRQTMIDLKNRNLNSYNEIVAPDYLYRKTNEVEEDETKNKSSISFEDKISSYHEGQVPQPTHTDFTRCLNESNLAIKQRFKPLPEYVFRDDLRSWHLG